MTVSSTITRTFHLVFVLHLDGVCLGLVNIWLQLLHVQFRPLSIYHCFGTTCPSHDDYLYLYLAFHVEHVDEYYLRCHDGSWND